MNSSNTQQVNDMICGNEQVEPPGDEASVLRDLQIHQLELEMQNLELRAARDDLETYACRFTELYDFAPVAYFSLSNQGVIRQLNLMAAKMLGAERDRLLGSKLSERLCPASQKALSRFLIQSFGLQPTEPCRLQLRSIKGHRHWLRINGALSPNGMVCRIAAMDITALHDAETTSEEKNDDLRHIFNLSLDMLGLAGSDGRFTRVNPAFERVLGHSACSLVRQNFLNFVHPDDRHETVTAMELLREGKPVLDFVNRSRRADGQYRWIEWRAVPSRSETYIALGRDITCRKEAEDAIKLSEQKFRSIVESMPTAMYLYEIGEDGVMLLAGANPAADREMAMNHENLLGKSAEEAFPGLIGTGIPEMFREIALGKLGPQTFVCRYDAPQLEGFYEVRAFQTNPGTMVAAFANVSERIRVENEQKKSQDELELRVQRRTAQLQDRTRQLRALACELTVAEERERQRIAGLIHDHLQQMLVAALLNLGMLRQKMTDRPEEEEFAQIETILRDSIETTRSLTAELSPTVLHQCGLAAALKWLGCWCQQKYGLVVEVEVEEDLNPSQEASISLFHSVREMLFNTVKHSGVKRAKVRMSRPDFGAVQIEVEDHGNGFDLLQVRAREGQEGGFGLFNVRERVELLGGRFEIESSPGHGSRFTIWIPELTEQPPMRKPAAAVEPDSQGHPQLAVRCRSDLRDHDKQIRLIIADDHPVVREGLARLLHATEGFEVVAQAEDGLEAVRLARQWKPDYVIMDLNMPKLDGCHATAVIVREMPEVRVLGLSTDADKELRAAMIRAGAVDLFHKSISSAKLVDALRCGLQPG